MEQSRVELALKQCGVKVTKQRVSILEVFQGGCKPVSAEWIFDYLNKNKKVKVDLATVYRNLQTLEANNLIRRVDIRGSSHLYELKDQNHHHHHIVCTDCGATEHFDVCIADSVTKKVLGTSKKFSMVTEHVLELFGVCKACLPKVKKS